MLTQPAKVIISFILSIISVILYFLFKQKERKICMFGMLSCTIGDIFMTDIVHMGPSSTYFGATFFIVGHIIYALCFINASREKHYKYINKGFYLGLILITVMIVSLTISMFYATKTCQSIYFPLLVYIVFIGINTVSQFSYAYNESSSRKLLIVAMLLFVISDFLVFLPMLNICKESVVYNDYIWFTYIPAQLLILLFNSDLKQTNKS